MAPISAADRHSAARPRRARVLRLAALAAACCVTGWSAAAGAAPGQDPPLPTQPPTPGELPPVTVSSTTLHDGDTITIAGTGCIDPDTGSGEGLEVVLLRPGDFGRGGIQTRVPTVAADANEDGTFDGSDVVEQPLFPDGAQTGVLSCQKKGDLSIPQSFQQREVELQIVAPSLPDLTVAAGSTFDYTLPCTITAGTYGFFGFNLAVPGLDDVAISVSGTFPEETSPQEGDTVALTVAADAPPGTYAATAQCGVSEAGTGAYFTGFSVTITAADGGGTASPTPTSTPPEPPASGPTAPSPAEPVAGTPSFTG